MDGITIRTAVPADLDAVVQVEAACFPAAEAADRSVWMYFLRAFW